MQYVWSRDWEDLAGDRRATDRLLPLRWHHAGTHCQRWQHPVVRPETGQDSQGRVLTGRSVTPQSPPRGRSACSRSGAHLSLPEEPGLAIPPARFGRGEVGRSSPVSIKVSVPRNRSQRLPTSCRESLPRGNSTMNLILRAMELQKQAHCVVRTLKLRERWEKIGDVTFSSSSAFGLMVQPNIDISSSQMD